MFTNAKARQPPYRKGPKPEPAAKFQISRTGTPKTRRHLAYHARGGGGTSDGEDSLSRKGELFKTQGPTPKSARLWINVTKAKMKQINLLPALVVLLFSIGVSLASETVDDPESDFVTNSLTYKSTKDKEQIIRIDADVFGDGNLVAFLRTVAGGGELGQYSTAYIPVRGGGFARVEDVQFREDTFKAGKDKEHNPNGGILAYYPSKRGGDLMRITFVGGETTTEKIRFLNDGKEEDRALFKKLFGRGMDEGLPRQYFENPPHELIVVKDILARADSQPEQLTRSFGTTAPTSVPATTKSSSESSKEQAPEAENPKSPIAETAQNENHLPWILAGASLLGILAFLLLKTFKGESAP